VDFLIAIENVENLIDVRNFKQATSELNQLAKSDSNNQHLVYLSAVLFDQMSEHEKSNLKLKQSIKLYEKLFDLDNVDSNLLYIAGCRLLNRLEFIGKIGDAIKYNAILLERFKNNIGLLNQQGINYLIADKPRLAKEQFSRVFGLTQNKNTIALCHYAFILKQFENKMNESIEYFRQCLLSREKSVMDGRFFYHLGDALQRSNRTSEVINYNETLKFDIDIG
jgi:aspartate beta-hydroxylase